MVFLMPSSTTTMWGRNSLLKIALIVILFYTKEGCAINDNAAIEEICSKQRDCGDSPFPPDFCRCDESCSLYRDCCPNAPKRNESTKKISLLFECSSSFEVYMIYRCPNNVGGELKEMCEGHPTPNEISLEIPATDVASGVTYRNYYCAMCNGADENSTVFWKARFYCELPPALEDFNSKTDLMGMILFDSNKEQWGILSNRSDENRTDLSVDSFFPCSLKPQRPYTAATVHAVHSCIPDLISSCTDEWEDAEVEEKCHSLHAPVFRYRMISYKNIYCAVCNNVSLSGLECHPVGIPEMDYVPSSFKILVDLNSADTQSECKEDEVLFEKECRELSCGFPHLVRRNGKCAPKD